MLLRHPFATDSIKFLRHRLAEAFGLPRVRALGLTTREAIDWLAYWRYKADLEAQAVEAARQKAEAERER